MTNEKMEVNAVKIVRHEELDQPDRLCFKATSPVIEEVYILFWSPVCFEQINEHTVLDIVVYWAEDNTVIGANSNGRRHDIMNVYYGFIKAKGVQNKMTAEFIEISNN